MKRYIIMILSLFLLFSCKNENKALKNRVRELEKINIKLEEKLADQFSFQRATINTIIYGPPPKGIAINDPKRCKDNFDALNFSSNLIHLNKENFKGYFSLGYILHNDHCKIEYTVLIKDRSELDNQILIEAKDDGYPVFTYQPKDTGVYYWRGEITMKNYISGKDLKFPIEDSFFVSY